jgi:hypothetical protein
VVEDGVIGILQGWVTIESLERLFDAIEQAGIDLSPVVGQEAHQAAARVIGDIRYHIEDEESESALEDHAKILQRLGERVGADVGEVMRAVEAVKDRIAELSEQPKSDSPSFSGKWREPDTFDDKELRNLFAPLTHDAPRRHDGPVRRRAVSVGTGSPAC